MNHSKISVHIATDADDKDMLAVAFGGANLLVATTPGTVMHGVSGHSLAIDKMRIFVFQIKKKDGYTSVVIRRRDLARLLNHLRECPATWSWATIPEYEPLKKLWDDGAPISEEDIRYNDI